jgi:hypothetical protein
LHTIIETQNLPAIDTLKGVFTEGEPAYPGAGFREKTHIGLWFGTLDASRASFAFL